MFLLKFRINFKIKTRFAGVFREVSNEFKINDKFNFTELIEGDLAQLEPKEVKLSLYDYHLR